ncbi:S-layer family protein [Nostoc sp. FACHB-110]|uniref:two-partner secretion domain-containing protein n=1 Tax=Nostoc sp. FACHB-110 TaxID=2692834 RepID=UPI0016881437|nr:S-layer family protein [Nostoc sp. FACHB-110]MBD2438800.1 S-layer family protein [Nostoc sp. FACHB-110]
MRQQKKRSQHLTSLAVGWALMLLGIQNSIFTKAAVAQTSTIQVDNTLGTESSIFIPDAGSINNLPVDAIIGEAQRGQNLFHSFQQFNVSAGRGAYFLTDSGIQNILARVTGNNVSQILGTLGVFGSNANLFLINPNGIIFGENARLDVGGSFIGTTANAIGFGNQGLFSASQSNIPSPLLTINPTAFLFNQVPQGVIANRAFGSELSNFLDIAELTNDLIDKIPGGLSVPEGQSLILLGGDVNLEHGEVGTFGGRVEIGGLSAPGTVGLNIDGGNFSLQFPQGIPRADVSLSNESTIYTFPNGGDIAINARNLNLSGASEIDTALSSELSTLFSFFSGQPFNRLNPGAGEININATNSVNLQNESFIGHVILGDTFNQGGGIRIATGSLNVQNSGIGIFSSGQGNLGDVDIQASDPISLNGVSGTDDSVISGIFVNLLPGAVGQGGDIRITTGSLNVSNGAQLNTTTLGSGNSGSIIVQARDNVIFDGADSGIGSFVAPPVLVGSQGNGGNVEITTGLLTLTNGGLINTSTFGRGNAGNVTINARNTVNIDGQGNESNPSRIISFVGPKELGTEGNGGNVKITTGSFNVINGGQIDTSTLGQGDGGSITINARNAVTINNQSTIGSVVGFNVANKGGDVQITTGSLFLNNGQINTATIGRGKAGDVNIQATDSFTATNTGVIGTFTLGSGDAGNVTINANNDVFFDNSSGVITGVVALGDILNKFGTSGIDESVLNNISSNVGAAGKIDISARTIKLDRRSFLSTITTSGNGGDIGLQAQDYLLLRRGSSIVAQAGLVGDGGNGGNITINTPFLIAGAGENTDIVANAFSGNGGKVEVNAQGIFGLQVLNRAEIEKLLNNANVFSADQLPTNDIVVFSQTNPSLNGEVALNTPDVDPTQGLVELPTNVVDLSRIVEQNCSAFNGKTGSQFIVSGRGGLPVSPNESLNSEVVWSDTRLSVAAKPQHNSKTQATRTLPSTTDNVPIVPATGWVSDRFGKVTLIAQNPNVSPLRPTPCTRARSTQQF